MRISDWRSDVCSSDLALRKRRRARVSGGKIEKRLDLDHPLACFDRVAPRFFGDAQRLIDLVLQQRRLLERAQRVGPETHAASRLGPSSPATADQSIPAASDRQGVV